MADRRPWYKRLLGIGRPEQDELPAEVSQAPVTAAHDPDLEANIASDPDAIDAYLVYADWLQGRGDPLGELITLQAQLAEIDGWEEIPPSPIYPPRGAPRFRRPPPSHPFARRAEALLRRHPAHLLGPLEAAAARGETLVEYRAGFVSKLRYKPSYGTEGATADLAAILGHRSTKFLRYLALGTLFDRPIVGILPDELPETLRAIWLGDFEFPDESEISWTEVGELSTLYTSAPRLETLIARGAGIGLGETVRLPALRHLELQTGGLPRDTLRAIVASELPELETLVVWTGSDGYGADTTADDVRALLRMKLPKLTRLGICNAEHAHEWADDVLESPLLPQLQALDLSMGTFDDAAAERFVARSSALAHLDELDLRENLMGDEAAAALSSLARNVHVDGQRPGDMDEEMRYVAVSE
jgi:uncharacterized protein (TIGR02996 family)